MNHSFWVENAWSKSPPSLSSKAPTAHLGRDTYVTPVRPFLQLQMKALPMGSHEPPFRQGFGKQAVISDSQFLPVNWERQLQWYPGRWRTERGKLRLLTLSLSRSESTHLALHWKINCTVGGRGCLNSFWSVHGVHTNASQESVLSEMSRAHVYNWGPEELLQPRSS